MLRIVLVGDTANYHSGCAQVCATITSQLDAHHIVKRFPPMHHFPDVDWRTVDAVVVNGEGTLHNNRPGAVGVLDFVQRAQQNHVATVLVNTVWQNMEPEWNSVVQALDYWSVRDRLSQQYAHSFGCTPDLYPDLSLNQQYPRTQTASGVAHGNTWQSRVRATYPSTFVSIFAHDWHTFVEHLQSHSAYATGRFHEICAAIVAQTPFWPIQGNSWKTQGLLADYEIPVMDRSPTSESELQDFVQRYQEEFSRLFETVANTPKLDINSKLKDISRTTS